MASAFSWKSYIIRLLIAFIIVFCTYNPSGYSFYHWVSQDMVTQIPIKAFAGITLLIGWIVYIRATYRSLGVIGIILATAFFGLLFWLLIDLKIISPDSSVAIQYILLVMLSFIISTGVSWSHLRRRLTGQMDVDDIEE